MSDGWGAYLLVALGGALGSAARFWVVQASARAFGPDFPWGTLSVNVIGSTLMGLLVGVLAQLLPSGTGLRLLLAVGFLGGFTTFSSFALDVAVLADRAAMVSAVLYVAASLSCSFLGLWLGRLVMRAMLGSPT